MEETNIKRISSEEFFKLDFSKVTLLDLREKDEVLAKGINGAINVPFSRIASGLSDLPTDKTIYVFCRSGDWSEEVVEILTDRGYDAVNVDGGYNAYSNYLKTARPVEIDAKGLKCPGPIVKVSDTMQNLKIGQKVHVQATEDAFVSDIAVWCDRTGNKLLNLEQKNGIIDVLIEKKTPPKRQQQNFQRIKPLLCSAVI